MPASKKASTAKRPAAKRSSATRRRKTRAPLEFGSRRYVCKATKGSLFLEGPDGQKWQPAACGVHRSGGVHETATDGADPKAAGFQPDCDDCKLQADATASHALQHAQV